MNSLLAETLGHPAEFHSKKLEPKHYHTQSFPCAQRVSLLS